MYSSTTNHRLKVNILKKTYTNKKKIERCVKTTKNKTGEVGTHSAKDGSRC